MTVVAAVTLPTTTQRCETEAMTVLTIERIGSWHGQDVPNSAGEKTQSMEQVHRGCGRLRAD